MIFLICICIIIIFFMNESLCTIFVPFITSRVTWENYILYLLFIVSETSNHHSLSPPLMFAKRGVIQTTLTHFHQIFSKTPKSSK